jgi:hypothetical protein
MERVHVGCVIKKETQSAILIDSGDQECWLPKSLIDIDHLGEGSGSAIVYVPEWLATDRGLV